MARPVVKRTLETYQRNLAELKVLRKAVSMDPSLDAGRAHAAIQSLTHSIDAIERLCADLAVKAA